MYRISRILNCLRVLSILGLCLASASASAVVFNVPADHATIQGAINAAAVSGDEIIVAPGTYIEVINFNGKAIDLHSASGNSADTIIDGSGLFESVVLCVSGEGAGTILEGFTITGGSGHIDGFGNLVGGGMFNFNSSPTITNCIFSGNTADFGGGMLNDGSSPIISDCSFSGNSTFKSGGGMYNLFSNPSITNCSFSGNTASTTGGGMFNHSSSPTITSCTFSGNTASNGGGGMFNQSSSPTITNCTFIGNSAANGGGINNLSSNPTITNCTFTLNTAGAGGGLFNHGASIPSVTNCIFWGDSPNEIFNFDGPSIPTFSFSNVQGGLGAGSIDSGGNLDLDPLFIDADGIDNIPGTLDDDLQLASGSPSTDAGINTATGLVGITTDLDGNPRFIDDPAVVDTGFGAPPIVDMGAYERQVALGPVTINVPGDFATIQGAINAAAASGDEIIVAPGTYNEVINFAGKAIYLHSASGIPADTIIDGSGQFESVVLCISGEGNGTILEGFTITGGAGNTSVFGGSALGGGMLNVNSSPTVTNCAFIGNSATNGGGMLNVNSIPTVTNCAFSGNTASNAGGGMFNQIGSSLMVTNCTFSGNTAILGGGMVNFSTSNPTITNCIFRGNSPSEITNTATTPTFSFSNVQGGLGVGSIDGGGNIDVDPLFIDADGIDNIPGTLDDDLRLADFSPSTDAGDNAAPGLAGITFDLDGNPRFIDDPAVVDTGFGPPPIVDMGPYERQLVTINVPSDFATIQGAIDSSAISGGEIIVAPGTYPEVINFNGKAIDLHSASGNPADTIIDGTGLFDSVVLCVSGEGAGTILEGFTITGGTGNTSVFGGSTRGGGMFNFGSSPTVTNCIFSGNSAQNAGGMLNNASTPLVTNCVFSGNTASNAGGGMFNQEGSSLMVTNCTFSGNSVGGSGGGMINLSGSQPTVTNCIFRGNSPNAIVNNSTTPTFSFSNVQGGLGAGSIDGGGNIDVDPLFVDADGLDNIPGTFDDDLRLAAGSPCTDAGDNTTPGLVGITFDLDGNPRFIDDLAVADTGFGAPPIVDMGPYERQLVMINVPSDFATIQGAINVSAISGGEIIVAPGTYPEVIDFLGKAVHLHSASGNPADTIIDGSGLSDSVVLCVSGEGAGTILEGFTITGGTGNTVVTGSPAGGGMLNVGSSPTVTKCIFSGNSTEFGGGMFNSTSSNPTITNCTFSGNTVSSAGGGMYNFSNCNPSITNCSFSGNTAVFGGGMLNNISSPTITNCTFSGNTASNGGGGMYNVNSSNPTITNCIFRGESPSEIFNITSDPTIRFSNVQGGFIGTGNIDLDPLFVDADGADNIPGTLDDDLRLADFSPSTDAGDNAAPGLAGITTDLDGNLRFIDDPAVADTGSGTPGAPIVDMGAYERQLPVCVADITPPGGNGVVNIDDLVAVLNGFGACPAPPTACPADITPPGGNGVVNIDDLVAVLNAFGACP